MKTHIVPRSGLHLFVSLALLLSSCGGGGGGSSPPKEPDRVGAGWITITASHMGTSGMTGPSTVSLSGDAFISPTWSRCCSGSGSDSGVTVQWENTTTGASGKAFQSPVYCWLLASFLCGHTWDAIIDLAVGNNVIQITATDPSGNLGRVTSTATGVPDSAPPAVLAATPAAGSGAVPTNTPITATFSEAMDPASISASSFLLRDNVNNPVSGSVAYINRVATFSPHSNLLGTVTYSATITGGARDVAGNPLAAPFQWSFTTAVAPDTTPPAISAAVPSGNCAATEAPLYVTFSEAVQVNTVGTGTFLLRDSSNTPITGSVGMDYLGRGYFDPDSTLANAAAYTGTLTTGIIDQTGNHLSADYSWTFTTQAAGTGLWSPTTSTGAPAPRFRHTAVWTGTEMIIWGGYDNTFGRYLSDGARYNPATDSWLPVSAVGAPIMTAIHAAVWTGSRMLINSGASLYLYDPVADSWSNVTIPGLIPRANATAVWTGTEMIIWGGYDGSSNKLFGDGMRYNPVTDTWSPVSATNAPAPRTGHTVVWNGSEMLVWGGGVANSGTLYTDTGGIYTPATDSWTAMPATGGAPSARIDHAAVWTGSEMIVWGGRAMNSLDSGARYSPTAHSWQPVSAFCLPMARGGHTGTWSGTEMLVWGGADNPNGPYFEAGGRYNPAADTWQAIPVAGMPGPRMGHSGIWTGSELIVWGGYDNSGAGHTLQAYNNGGRYRPQ